MIKVLLLDFSRVLIFPKESTYMGRLNDLYKEIISKENYEFYNHYSLNKELLEYLAAIKGKYSLAIYTTEILQNDPAVRPIIEKLFSHVFSANDLGVSKKDMESYLIIAKTLKVKPEEILFIDDTLGNIETASQAGLQTIQFTSNEQLFKELKAKI